MSELVCSRCRRREPESAPYGCLCGPCEEAFEGMTQKQLDADYEKRQVRRVALASRNQFANFWMSSVLERLARVEQALAEIKGLHTLGSGGFCDCCEFPFPCRTIAAVRASQGGQ